MSSAVEPEDETAVETDAPPLAPPEPPAPPPEGFAAGPLEPEPDAPDSAALPSPAAASSSDAVGDAPTAPAVAHETPSRGWVALNEVVAACAQRSIDIAARTAIDMLGVKTWSDAVAVNTAFARRGFAEWLDSSAKISAAGLDLAAESAKPFLAGLPGAWSLAPNTARPL